MKKQHLKTSTPPAKMINWFEVDKKGNFIRTFAPLIKIEDNALIVLLQGKEMQINSKYSIRDYLEEDASILYMFSNTPSIVDKIRSLGFKKGELFPLPAGRSYFDSTRDLSHNYKTLSQKELDEYIHSDPDVKNLEIALENAKKEVENKLESIKKESVYVTAPSTSTSIPLKKPIDLKQEIALKTKKISSKKVKTLSRKSQKHIQEMFS